MSSHFNKLAVIEGIKALPKDFDDLTRLFIEMLPFCLLLCSDTVAEIATADFIILYHFERWRQHEGYIYASKTKVPSKAELCKFIWLRHALISCCHRMLHWRQETIAGSLLYVDYGLWPNPPSNYTQTRTQTHTHHSPNINTSVLKFHSNRNVTTTTTSNQPPAPNQSAPPPQPDARVSHRFSADTEQQRFQQRLLSCPRTYIRTSLGWTGQYLKQAAHLTAMGSGNAEYGHVDKM